MRPGVKAILNAGRIRLIRVPAAWERFERMEQIEKPIIENLLSVILAARQRPPYRV